MAKLGCFLMILLSLGLLKANAQDTLTAKAEFKPSGKISGYIFGDYAYKLHADALQRGNVQYSRLPENYNSFNIRRIYLGYDFQFSTKISSQLLLAHESTFEADPAKTDALTDHNRAVYIKYANIRFKDIIPRADIVFGQQATPTFHLSEHLWGYRSIEKTIADMRSISSSNDLGIGIFGKIGKAENIGYDILIGNNNGAKLENNIFKKVYTSLYAYFLDKKLVLQVNYEHDRGALLPGLHKNINLYKAFIGYKTKNTNIGVEAFRQIRTNDAKYIQDNTTADTSYVNTAPSGVSVFYTQVVEQNKLNVFARIDFYDPDANYSTGKNYINDYSTAKEIFATIGLDFIPYKNIHIMPNIWYNSYQSKLSNASGSLKNDYDLVGRLTLYFLFNK
jgi:hypothetical protein